MSSDHAADTLRPPTPPSATKYNRGVNRSFAPLRAISALILREMATSYGRSPGGYIWALIEPLAGVMILSVGFSLVAHVPPLGNSFILFFATGMLPFSFYSNLTNNVSRSINFSRALLFYPSVTWVDAVLARFVLNTLTDILVMLILFTGLIIGFDLHVDIRILPILQAISLVALLSLGLGLVNCVLFGIFPIWMHIWSIINKPMFIISGIFFLYDDLPDAAQPLLWYNPLIHIVGLMRKGFYSTYEAQYVSATYVLMISLICMFVGTTLMRRYHRHILNL